VKKKETKEEPKKKSIYGKALALEIKRAERGTFIRQSEANRCERQKRRNMTGRRKSKDRDGHRYT